MSKPKKAVLTTTTIEKVLDDEDEAEERSRCFSELDSGIGGMFCDTEDEDEDRAQESDFSEKSGLYGAGDAKKDARGRRGGSLMGRIKESLSSNRSEKKVVPKGRRLEAPYSCPTKKRTPLKRKKQQEDDDEYLPMKPYTLPKRIKSRGLFENKAQNKALFPLKGRQKKKEQVNPWDKALNKSADFANWLETYNKQMERVEETNLSIVTDDKFSGYR